jgi:hypothetical protein
MKDEAIRAAVEALESVGWVGGKADLDKIERALRLLREAQGEEMPQGVEVTKYTIDGDPRRLGSDDIHIERAKQIEGPPKWAVRRMGECLNKQGEWEWEPMPSSRDDEFLTRCRFDSAKDAIRAAAIRSMKKDEE